MRRHFEDPLGLKIVKPAQMIIRRNRPVLQDPQKMLGLGLDDRAVPDQVEGLLRHGALIASTVRPGFDF